ncbi:type 1 glutamine amidotransferase domain-containing protein [Alteromonas sp. KUL49]|uniref:type 1 glutamine amidotransferase domain-containing protein n=1 Tax=Alteromonas sp. KUL49 TaxID=2480798 RepID=UPI00102EF84F|nr:type 1 glutamine amidotransferase domain-containing protein [Alteromonas sp. KUL49]TAP38629.1 type 1 glutamine amidotransferase domain-containing protein [Alteromonas sp. KUL49]GEA12571.1 hypothetical protein KUL49_29460 [Alteromonas sp. KUL49]
MKQLTRYTLIVASYMALFFTLSAMANVSEQQRILMVLSGYGEDGGKTAPGFEFDEFSKAYVVFKQNGLAVDIASPEGGVVVADEYDPNRDFNQAVLNDPQAMAMLNDTLSTADVDARNYQGVFIVGGKGAMFDLPKDTALQSIIANVYQSEGSVAAVCHGPAALIDVKLDDGSYLVAGKAVNGFTNIEENLFASKWLSDFDFMLEDKLIERGGRFESSAMMLSHVTVDSRLVTGQNPSSTVAVAVALVESMGITPKPAASYRDDRTLALVAEVLAGDDSAARTLLSDAEYYQQDLVGMYGYYYLQTAQTPESMQHALTLMQVGREAIGNPLLDVQIAKTQHELGDSENALALLKQTIAANPDFEPARALLQSLTL